MLSSEVEETTLSTRHGAKSTAVKVQALKEKYNF